MKKNIYLISGLGANEQAFRNLDLKDEQIIYIKWIEHKSNETLKEYALRLAEQIDHSSPFILIGVSLGGMMAMEIAKKFKPEKTILISSIKTISEQPYYFQIFRWFPIYKLLPDKLLLRPDLVFRFLFPTAVTRKWGVYFKEMFLSNSPSFIRWEMQAALHFSNDSIPENVIHIHGTKDKVFPISDVKGVIPVANGSHIMVFTRGKEVSEIILKNIYS